MKEVKISSINHQRRILESDFWNSLGLFNKAMLKISFWKRARIIGMSVKWKSLELYGEAGVLQVMNVRFMRVLCFSGGYYFFHKA